MKWLGQFGRRLMMLVRRREFDRDLDEEMRLHREWRERVATDSAFLSVGSSGEDEPAQ